jgi:zinc transporter ZupT
VKEKPMSNEQKDPQSKKTTNQIGQWLAIGISIGASLGIIFHNIPIGVALGIMLGTSIGLALSQKNKKD